MFELALVDEQRKYCGRRDVFSTRCRSSVPDREIELLFSRQRQEALEGNGVLPRGGLE
jgi:hypothetical protein